VPARCAFAFFGASSKGTPQGVVLSGNRTSLKSRNVDGLQTRHHPTTNCLERDGIVIPQAPSSLTPPWQDPLLLLGGAISIQARSGPKCFPSSWTTTAIRRRGTGTSSRPPKRSMIASERRPSVSYCSIKRRRNDNDSWRRRRRRRRGYSLRNRSQPSD